MPFPQFIHLGSVKRALQDTRAGVAGSTIYSVARYGELSTAHFVAYPERKLQDCRRGSVIGVPSPNDRCFKQCLID
jgi:hypothetical protein